MASGDKEHRMLFDIRGKRRNVVKAVYAVLAVLMGLSLFLVTGSVNLGGLFGDEAGSNTEAAGRLEDKAVAIEAKLAKEPENADLHLALTRNHISTSSLLSEIGPAGEPLATVESRAQLEKASSAWSEYLETTDEPAAGPAQQMSQSLFLLAQTSRSLREANDNITAATEAQAIVSEQRPSLGSLSTQALYTLYTFGYKEANELLAEALKLTNTKAERESLQKQFDEVEKRARTLEKEFNQAKKQEKQAGGGANPQESLQNPFGLGTGPGLAE